MPQADFYVLPAAEIAARQRFICRLAEKIVPAGHQLYIHCDNAQVASELDQLLWSFKAESFIPHALADSNDSAPVVLGWELNHIDPTRVFVNLTLTLPESVPGTERVVEIVVQTDDVLTATRQRFKQYKDAGYEINMNDMRAKR